MDLEHLLNLKRKSHYYFIATLSVPKFALALLLKSQRIKMHHHCGYSKETLRTIPKSEFVLILLKYAVSNLSEAYTQLRNLVWKVTVVIWKVYLSVYR